MRLPSPVRVEADSGDDLNETEDDVSVVQLILMTPTLMTQYRGLKHQAVIVIGTLSHQITGHHYTKVLITVQKIERP